MNDELGEVRITPHVQLVLLALLHDTGPQPWYPAALAQQLRFGTDTVSTILRRLEHAGWVARQVERNPHRQFQRNFAHLTDAGARRARAILPGRLSPTSRTLAGSLGLSLDVLDPSAAVPEQCPAHAQLGWTGDFTRNLGEELRRLRLAKGWSRRDLREAMTEEIGLPTLAAYELGTRQMSIIRLVQLTHALSTTVAEILTRVHQRTFTHQPGWAIDLAATAKLTDSALAPARRWAAHQLTTAARPFAWLPERAASALADLCDLPLADLLARLPRPSTTEPPTNGDRQ